MTGLALLARVSSLDRRPWPLIAEPELRWNNAVVVRS